MSQITGICIPSGCSLNDVQKNYKAVYKSVKSVLNGALAEIPDYPGCEETLGEQFCGISHSCVTIDTFENYVPNSGPIHVWIGDIHFTATVGQLIFL